MIRLKVRGGRGTAVDVSPAGSIAGGSHRALPATICDCGEPGAVVVDQATFCAGCYLDQVIPFRRRLARRRIG